MDSTQIRQYMERYFTAQQCRFLAVDPGYFTVKLSVEADKDLGNRPFYWSYVERLGMEPNTLTLTFIFDKEQVPDGFRGEEITFGSPRLHQIFKSTAKHGKYVRLYQLDAAPVQRIRRSVPLIPWLYVNYRVEFLCDRKKDWLLPLGINLISGLIEDDFYEKMQRVTWSPKIPDYSFTMQPIFSLDSAVTRLEKYIEQKLEAHDETWAIHASSRLADEIKLIESFYEQSGKGKDTAADADEHAKRQAEKERRIKELKWQYEPRIRVDIVNAALLYVRQTNE